MYFNKLYFKLFPISQKGWKLGFVNVALVGLLSFFSIYERNEVLEFFNVSLGCTSKFLKIH